MNPKIKILPFDFAVITDDTHFSKWIEEAGSTKNPFFELHVAQHIQPGFTVIDGGAYIGDQTIHYANAVGLNGHVIAFEPNPLPFECLEYNVRNLPQVICHRIGISHANGYMELAIEEGNYGASRLTPGTGTPIISLDRYPLTRLDFVKLDIEGMELDALLGSENVLEELRPVIYIEVHNLLMKAKGQSFADVRKLLESHRYTVKGLDWKELGDENADMFDVLAKPTETL